jgi:Putative zinc-finger
MSQACAGWRGDIGAYVVGALSPVEAARMRRHLRNCAACRAEYEDLIPVPHWLSRMNPADGMPPRQPPDRPPPEPARPRQRFARQRFARQRFAQRRLAAAGTVIAAVAIAVITALSAHHPAGPGFHAADPRTGVSGQATLRGTPTGTQISLALTGLPAGQHCILVTVSRTGTAVAGTWTAETDGTAEITGATAIPLGRLIALRIDAPTDRLLLNIPL